jgi:hypothetical protein
MKLVEYIKILNDIDGYISHGGRLLDLPLYDMENVDPAIRDAIEREVEPEKLARVGALLQRVGAWGKSDETVGRTITEERVRAIWRGL